MWNMPILLRHEDFFLGQAGEKPICWANELAENIEEYTKLTQHDGTNSNGIDKFTTLGDVPAILFVKLANLKEVYQCMDLWHCTMKVYATAQGSDTLFSRCPNTINCVLTCVIPPMLHAEATHATSLLI